MGTHDGARILLVEDDATISDLVAYYLRRAGFQIDQEYDGRAALSAVAAASFDLVLMDILLPGLDGLTATREVLRRRPGIPVIILSALSEKQAMLEAFALGAADFITKPFDVDVLLARIAAALRRSGGLGTPPNAGWPSSSDLSTEASSLHVDPNRLRLCSSTGEVSLTPKEHGLLELFLSQPGHLFSKAEITESVWHHKYVSSSRTLDVHIRRLRDKLRLIDAGVDIFGVRGVGYRMGGCSPAGAGTSQPESGHMGKKEHAPSGNREE